jgi:hypothetical protein
MILAQAKLDSLLATDSPETFIIHGPLILPKFQPHAFACIRMQFCREFSLHITRRIKIHAAQDYQ